MTSLLSVNAQNDYQFDWQQAYGGIDSDKASGIIALSDNNLLSFGYYKSTDGDFSTNYGNYDIFVRKMDYSGNEIWSSVFGGTNVDYVYDAIEDSTGNIILVGTSKSDDNDITGNHGDYDVLVVKLSNTGTILWQKSFGGTSIDKATSVIETANNEYYVLAYSKSTDGDITNNIGGYDVWLLKIDSTGAFVSQKNYGGSLDDKSHKFYKNSNGDIFITAYSKSNNNDVTINHGNYDFWVFEIDNAGTIGWNHSYGGSGIDKEPVIIENLNGQGFIIAGTSSSDDGDISQYYGSFDICLLKVNGTGSLVWQKNIGGTGADFVTGIQKTPGLTGDISLIGYTNSDDNDFPVNYGSYDSVYFTIDGNGNLQSKQNFGGDDTEQFTDFTLIPDITDGFDIYISGTTKSDNNDVSGQHGNYDAWFAHIIQGSSSVSTNNVIDVSIYPNPSKNFIQIKAEKIQQIQLIDITGKVLLSKYNIKRDNFKLEFTNFPKGNYLLKITTQKGIAVRKIIVE